MNCAAAYIELTEQLRHQADIAGALRLLQWDQETYMPAGVGATRARQIGVLASLLHELRTAPRFLALVDELSERQGELAPELHPDVRETKWRLDRERALPPSLVRERSELHAESRNRWVDARAAGDFQALRPYLSRVVDIEREAARCIDPGRDPYEVLLESYEPGTTLAAVHEVFDALRNRLRPFVERLPAATARATALQGDFPIDGQQAFNRRVATAIGFDFTKGRLDVAAHPFTISIGDDVRLTTRYDGKDLRYSLYSTIHEAGHGLYEQGLATDAWGLPRGTACSLGVHESQSRFWENIVGRSGGFWEFFLASAKADLPTLHGARLPDVVLSANDAKRSLIRTEADEITYNLHVILRFDLERRLIAGTLPVNDLPVAWRDAISRELGVVPQNDAEGCLQDVHWASGAIGYFPTYTLGNIYAAELALAAEIDLGSLHDLTSRGEFGELLAWLRRRIHRLGQTYRAPSLIASAIGREANAEALLAHLRAKSDMLASR